MGESFFGKLRDVLSREKTSDIDGTVSIAASPANLARIGLATGNPVPAAMPDDHTLTPEVPLPAASPAPSSADIAPVGIQFFAEVPTQESANEIVSVSQSAENCLTAVAQPSADNIWSVAVTLCMAPVPQEIHTIETVFQSWAQKLGGTSKGWGLNQAA